MPTKRDSLEKLTVAALRELAKKQLGRGTSKLRTKAVLIEALLASVQPEAAVAPRRGSKPAPRPPAVRKVARSLPRTPGAAAGPMPPRANPAAVVEPLLALPLDGDTLLVRWSPVPVRGAGERLELEISSDGAPARIVPIASQSRQAYIRALPSGAVYRATLMACGPGEARRVVGAPSRPVVFFPQPEAFRAGERFVHYSWSEPAASALGPAQPAPGNPRLSPSGLLAPGPGVDDPTKHATSPAGSIAGAPLGWLLSSRRPTSFAN